MKDNVWKKLKWCWKYTKEDMPLVIVSLFLSLILAYINTLEPLYTGTLIDDLIIVDFYAFIIKLIKLFTIQGVGILFSIFIGKISLDINKRSTIRGEKLFFAHVIRRENFDWLQGRKSEVLNTLQNDISVVLGVWTNVIPSSIASFFTLFIVSYRLLSINIVAFVLTIILSLIPFIVHHVAGKKELVLNTEAKKYGDRYVQTVQDSVSMSYESEGISRILFIDYFLNRIKDSFFISYKKFNLSQTYRMLLFFINIATVSTIYFFLGRSIMIGENSVGDFMVAVLYSQQIRSLIQNYGTLYQSILAKSISIDRVKSFIEYDDAKRIEIVHSEEPFMSVHNVDFSYGERKVFNNYSLSIIGTGIYVIKGKNGSGKTTLLKLLSLMIEGKNLKNGSIMVGGIEGEEDIAYIPALPHIAAMTIKDNLLLGYKRKEEDIIEVIKRVGLLDWFNLLPEGLDTLFDQKKIGLSQGQMIRFVLASNLLRERKIYLIDEIEDGIDTESRGLILNILSELSKTKIVVLVSHSEFFDSKAKSIIRIE